MRRAASVSPFLRTITCGLALLAGAPPTLAAETTRVSVASNGLESDGSSGAPAISGDGRFIAFESVAHNLVSQGQRDRGVFLHDRLTHTTTVISIGMDGRPTFGSDPSISGDGRFIAFTSAADDLVEGDTNGETDVFLADRSTGDIRRVTTGPGGTQRTGPSFAPAISADGRFVAFASTTGTLPGDRGSRSDVFIHDIQTAHTNRVSTGNGGHRIAVSSGDCGLAISADGSVLAFSRTAWSTAPGNFTRRTTIAIRDRHARRAVSITRGRHGRAPNADSCDPALSADGRIVAFSSTATNLPTPHQERSGVFTFDGRSRELRELPGHAPPIFEPGVAPSLSADGQLVAFADPLAANTGQVYLFDRRTATTRTVSLNRRNRPADDSSEQPALAANARAIAFSSHATDLVPDDRNGVYDVFVRDLP